MWNDRTVRIIRRTDIADPIGYYWRIFAPEGSTAWLFAHMDPEDRAEVASDCFQDAQFLRDGSLFCNHCGEEYLCEVIAALILVPPGTCLDDLNGVVDLCDVDPWVVRFRRLLDGLVPIDASLSEAPLS